MEKDLYCEVCLLIHRRKKKCVSTHSRKKRYLYVTKVCNMSYVYCLSIHSRKKSMSSTFYAFYACVCGS